jgi:hypothetical protein
MESEIRCCKKKTASVSTSNLNPTVYTYFSQYVVSHTLLKLQQASLRDRILLQSLPQQVELVDGRASHEVVSKLPARVGVDHFVQSELAFGEQRSQSGTRQHVQQLCLFGEVSGFLQTSAQVNAVDHVAVGELFDVFARASAFVDGNQLSQSGQEAKNELVRIDPAVR